MAAVPVQARTTLHIERTLAAPRERVLRGVDQSGAVRALVHAASRLVVGRGDRPARRRRLARDHEAAAVALLARVRDLPRGRPSGAACLHDSWQRAPFGPESLVTVDFHELDGATKIVIMHERLETRRGRASHAWGWRHSLERLREMVENV